MNKVVTEESIPTAVLVVDGNAPSPAYAAPTVQEMKPDATPMVETYVSGNVLVKPTANLAALENRTKLGIHQHVSMLEILCGCEESNKYDISDMNTGEPVLFIQEESQCCERIMCAPLHSATLKVYDVRPGVPPQTLVMVMKKPFKCFHCFSLCNCCRAEMTAETPEGETIGKISQPFCGGGFTPEVIIMDREGNDLGVARGPTCCVGGLAELCSDLRFVIDDEKHISTSVLTKKKPDSLCGTTTELLSDADQFVLDMPATLTNDQRGALLTGSILIDYLFFENGALVKHNPDGSFKVNCFDVYCFGCLCHCTGTCGGSSKNSNNNNNSSGIHNHHSSGLHVHTHTSGGIRMN